MPTQPTADRSRRSPGLLIGLLAIGLVVLVGGGAMVFALRPTGNDGNGGGGNHAGPGDAGAAASPACGYKIAYLGVLSGDNASDGTNIRDSVKLATEQYNDKHPSCSAQLVEFDTGYDSDKSTELAKQVAGDDKILGVVGPVYLSEIDAALPELEKAGVATITPAASDPGLSLNGWRVFHRTLGTDIDQAGAAARYLKQLMKAKKTVVVGDDSQFGRNVSAEVGRQLGDASAGTISIKRDDKDFSAAVGQVNSSGADALYLGAYYDDGALFVKQLRASNKTIKIVSGDRVFTDIFIDTAGKAAAEGTVMTCPCIPASKARNNFAAQFRTRYNHAAGYYGPEAFDAANILLAGLNAGTADRAAMLKYVDSYDGEGVSRRIKFTAHGDLDVTRLQVWAYRVSNGYVEPEQAIPDV
jgi:ABC-type branched-subunit amino acid transport system substrate-binding protein